MDGVDGTASPDAAAAWLLTADERGNPATAIDAERGNGQAWTAGNHVTVHVDGAYCACLQGGTARRARENEVTEIQRLEPIPVKGRETSSHTSSWTSRREHPTEHLGHFIPGGDTAEVASGLDARASRARLPGVNLSDFLSRLRAAVPLGGMD